MRVVLLLLCLFAVPIISEAKPKDPVEKREKAEKLFSDASLAYKLQKYDEALLGFQNAYALTEEPALLFNIAQCYRQLLRLTEAKKAYQSFIHDDPNNPLRPNAEARLTEIEAEILRLSQKGFAQISTQQDPAEIFFDGESRGNSPLNLSDLEPGEHKITVKKEGFIDFEIVATIKSGETYDLKVPPLISTKSLQKEGRPPKIYFLGAATLGGLGAISIGASGLVLRSAIETQDNLDNVPDLSQKQAEIENKRDASIFLARVSVGLLVGAAISAGIGVTKKRAQTQPSEVKP